MVVCIIKNHHSMFHSQPWNGLYKLMSEKLWAVNYQNVFAEMLLKKFDHLSREIIAVQKWPQKGFWWVMTGAAQLIAPGITWDSKKFRIFTGRVMMFASAQRTVWEVSEVWRVESVLRVPLTNVWTQHRICSLCRRFFYRDARTKPKQPAGPAGDPLTTKTCAPIKNTGVWLERACFNYSKLRGCAARSGGTRVLSGSSALIHLRVQSVLKKI